MSSVKKTKHERKRHLICKYYDGDNCKQCGCRAANVFRKIKHSDRCKDDINMHYSDEDKINIQRLEGEWRESHKKGADVPLSARTIPQLQDICRKHKLNQKGKKNAIIARIKAFYKQNKGIANFSDDEPINLQDPPSTISKKADPASSNDTKETAGDPKKATTPSRPLNEYKVSELREFLSARSLPIYGLKKVLIERLNQALEKVKQTKAAANNHNNHNNLEDSDDEPMTRKDPHSTTSNKAKDKEGIFGLNEYHKNGILNKNKMEVDDFEDTNIDLDDSSHGITHDLNQFNYNQAISTHHGKSLDISQTSSDSFKMTQCKPYISGQSVSDQQRIENQEKLKELTAARQKKYKSYQQQQSLVSAVSPSPKKDDKPSTSRSPSPPPRRERERVERDRDREMIQRRNRDRDRDRERERDRRDRDREHIPRFIPKEKQGNEAAHNNHTNKAMTQQSPPSIKSTKTHSSLSDDTNNDRNAMNQHVGYQKNTANVTYEGFNRPLNQYKVDELKKFLRARSLKVGGIKKVLIERLTQALEKEKQEKEAANNDNNDNNEDSDDDQLMTRKDPPSTTSTKADWSCFDVSNEAEEKENNFGKGNILNNNAMEIDDFAETGDDQDYLMKCANMSRNECTNKVMPMMNKMNNFNHSSNRITHDLNEGNLQTMTFNHNHHQKSHANLDRINQATSTHSFGTTSSDSTKRTQSKTHISGQSISAEVSAVSPQCKKDGKPSTSRSLSPPPRRERERVERDRDREMMRRRNRDRDRQRERDRSDRDRERESLTIHHVRHNNGYFRERGRGSWRGGPNYMQGRSGDHREKEHDYRDRDRYRRDDGRSRNRVRNDNNDRSRSRGRGRSRGPCRIRIGAPPTESDTDSNSNNNPSSSSGEQDNIVGGQIGGIPPSIDSNDSDDI